MRRPHVLSRASRAVIIGAVLMGTTLAGQTPPPPPPPIPPPPASLLQTLRDPGAPDGETVLRIPIGTAQVSGTVTDAASGRPLAGARVSLTGGGVVTTGRGSSTGMSRLALSDDQGRFAFDRLPAGRYALGANRNLYLSAAYGARRPGGAGTAIVLAEGQRLDLAMPMTRGGVITGTVVDELGEPQPHAQVRAMRYSMTNGIRRLQSVAALPTDDRGQYRVFGLQAGDYVVSATPNAGSLNADRALAEALALEEKIRSASPQEAATGASVTVVVSAPDPTIRSQAGRSGFLPTYYPGVMQADAAAAIRVTGGDEHAGIDIVVRAVEGTTVSGTISPEPADNTNIRVSLLNADGTALDTSVAGSLVSGGNGGRFVLHNLPPGVYQLLALPMAGPQIRIVNGASSASEAQQRTDDAQPLSGRTTIVVSGEPEIQAHIVMERGRTISGIVQFDTSAPVDLTRGTGTVTMAEVTGIMVGAFRPPQAQVGPDGRFTIRGVVPGRYILRTSLGSLKEAIVDGRDTLDFPLEVTGERDIAGAVLTVTDKVTELAGVLTDSRDEPASSYSVVVASADPRFRTPGSQRVALTRPDTNGRYSFRGLPPGDYLVAVVDDIEPGSQYDPEFLRGLEGSAVRVTLVEGASTVSDLRIGR